MTQRRESPRSPYAKPPLLPVAGTDLSKMRHMTLRSSVRSARFSTGRSGVGTTRTFSWVWSGRKGSPMNSAEVTTVVPTTGDTEVDTFVDWTGCGGTATPAEAPVKTASMVSIDASGLMVNLLI